MGYRRAAERNRRLKKLHAETRNTYGAGAYFDSEKGRLAKYSVNKKSVRQMGNRRLRRKRIDFAPSVGWYRRAYDYWWTVI